MNEYISILLLLIGCASKPTITPDAGISQSANNKTMYIQYKAEQVKHKYMLKCVRLCYIHTQSDECYPKCKKDFVQVIKVLTRAINEDKEEDFDAMIDTWYSGNE
jgi:hypothetical protein